MSVCEACDPDETRHNLGRADGRRCRPVVVISALTRRTSLLHGARVSARVEATQRRAWPSPRSMEELHSACVTPQIAPVKAESAGTALRFVHAAGAEARRRPIAQASSASKTASLSPIRLRIDWRHVPELDLLRSTQRDPPAADRRRPDPAEQLDLQLLHVRERNRLRNPAEHATREAAGADHRGPGRADRRRRPAPPSPTPVPSSVQDSADPAPHPPSFNEGATSLPCQ